VGGPSDRAEALAVALREAHPGVEPLDLDPSDAARWVAEAGGDGDDDALVAAALVAWESLL
jgi:hypothetical protein